jgi:hypothetical protein
VLRPLARKCSNLGGDPRLWLRIGGQMVWPARRQGEWPRSCRCWGRRPQSRPFLVAPDHFHRRAVCRALLLRRHAARRAPLRSDAPGHAASGAESLNVAAASSWADQAPAHDPPLPRMTSRS